MDMVKTSPDWPSNDAQELHVLAVDDSFVDRKVIERLLKISCCKVTAVESGSRALQYLGLDGEKRSVGFDDLKVNLIMTDFSMPGMTGFELLQKIKSSSKLKEIPVVIMSSENILSRVDRCLEEGAEDYLVKPVKLSDVQRIRDCILKGDEKNNATEITRKRNISDDLLSLLPAPSFLPSPASILASKQLARGASTRAKNERFHLFQCNRQMPPNCCDDTRPPQNTLLLGNHKLHLVGSSSL